MTKITKKKFLTFPLGDGDHGLGLILAVGNKATLNWLSFNKAFWADGLVGFNTSDSREVSYKNKIK